MIYFGLTVRRAAKAFGIEWRTAPDQRFGNVQVIPMALLRFVMREILTHPQNRLEFQNREAEEVAMLVDAVGSHIEPGEKRILSFNELIDAARILGLFENLGLNAGELNQRLRSTIGKRLSEATGQKFGDLKFDVEGTGRYRKFSVRRDEIVL